MQCVQQCGHQRTIPGTDLEDGDLAGTAGDDLFQDRSDECRTRSVHGIGMEVPGRCLLAVEVRGRAFPGLLPGDRFLHGSRR